MLTRLITGIVLAPLVVALLLWGPLWSIVVVLTLVASLSAWELVAMSPVCRPKDQALVALLVGALASSPFGGGSLPFVVLTLAPVVLLAWATLRPGDLAEAGRRAAVMVLALAYVGAMAAAMVAIASLPTPVGPAPAVDSGLPFGPCALLTLFIIVFSGDTGAYFGGRLMGRHKLAPTISPKKTVEGTVFGLAASVGGAFLAATYLVPQLDATEMLVMGLLCGTVAQVGDLAESLFKRAMDTKDSGRILPGHGGMLDRIDGVLFADPVFFAWLHFG